MESVLIAALLAASSPAAGATALDRSCFGLMAELAEAGDPRVADAGRIGAQFFLGRIDATEPDFDPTDGPVPPAAGDSRMRLLRQCGDVMEAGGLDFRELGASLDRPRRPTV